MKNKQKERKRKMNKVERREDNTSWKGSWIGFSPRNSTIRSTALNNETDLELRQDVTFVDGRIKRDLWGHDVHTHSDVCITLLNRYYIQVLNYGRDKRVIVAAANADRSCALACALAAAYLWAPQRSTEFSPDVVVFLSAAKANLERASAYEKLVVAALLDWTAGHDEEALNGHLQVLNNYPRDLGSLKRAQTLCFQMGRTSDMLRIAWQVLNVNIESPYIYGVLSFALLEVGSITEAENFARLALSIEDQDTWAQHALCHALQHQCRFKEALAFMSGQSQSWDNCCTFLYSHNWWHMAVCQLELGGWDAINTVLAIFDTRICGTRPACKASQFSTKDLYARAHGQCDEQCYIDGLGLLLRLELRGHNIIVGERISKLADSIKGLMACDQEELLLEVLSVWALSRANHLAEAKQRLSNIGCRILAVEGLEREVRQLVIQLSTALYEFGRANFELVCQELGPHFNIRSYKLLGASNEQLEVFEEMWCVSNLRARHFERVIQIIKQRIKERPGVSFYWRILEEACSKTGQGAEAKLAATKAQTLEAAADED